MSTLAQLMVEVGVDLGQFTRDMNRISESLRDTGGDISDTMNDADGDTSSASSGIIGSLKGIAVAVAGAFALDKIVGWTSYMLETTSELQAMQGQYDQVMGGMKSSTDKYLDGMSQKWNKHPNELKSAYMQYVALLKGKGVAEKDAHKIAEDMLERTVDSNAFANESMEDTTARYMGLIKGEYDSLDTAMVNLNQTMLNDKAQEVYGKKWEDLSVKEQELLKVQEAVRQHTSAGVFGQGEREADSYSNNLAMLQNTWKDLVKEFGTPVLAIANSVLKGLVKVLEGVNFEAISSGFSKLGDSFDKTTGLVSSFGGIFQKIKPIISDAISVVVEFVKSKMSGLAEFWAENGSQFLDACSNVWDGIKAVFDFILPAILFVVKYVWNAIKGVINGALNIIMGVVKVFSGLFTGDFSKMWEGVKQLFKGAIQFVWNLMSLTFVGGLRKLIVNLSKNLVKGIKSMWDSIRLYFMYGKDKVVSIMNSAKGVLVNVWNAIKNTVVNVAKALWNGIKSIFTAMRNTLSTIMAGIRTTASSVWNAIKSTIVNVAKAIWNGVKATFNAMKDGVVSAFNSIKSKASSIFNQVKNAITNPIETAKNTVLGIVEKIKSAFSGMRISIPTPKLPSIEVGSKSFMEGKVKVPTFKINWNAKGGIYNGASLLGGGQGVGEAGAEAVIPIQHKRYMSPFASAVADNLPQHQAVAVDGKNTEYSFTIPLYMDGREIARGTAKFTKEELDRLEKRENRMGGDI